MKDFFLNNYMNIILKNNSDFSQDDIDKMKYGIEGIYLTITKLVVICILGIILGIIKEIVILLLFYNVLRFFGFGYHAKGSKQCLLFSITFFVLLPLLSVKSILTFKYKGVILSLCLINFLLFAPSDTKKRPMINKKKKLIRKTLLILVTILYSVLTFKVESGLASLIIIAIVIESIMVNPLIYMLTKEPYNNYKNYLKED